MIMSKKNKYAVMAGFAAALVLMLFAVVYITGVYKFIGESEIIPIKLQIIGFTAVASEFGFIILARVKKFENPLKGYFIFKLLGVVAFIICFAMKIVGAEADNSFFFYIFDLWTVMLRPLSFLIAPVIGVSEFFRKAASYSFYILFRTGLRRNTQTKEV